MGQAKSRLGLNKDISNTWMKEFEESLGGVGALGHEESLGWEGDSIRLGPRLEELEQSGGREVGLGDVASIDHVISGEILGHMVVDDRGNVQGLVSGQKKGYEVDQLVVEGKGIHSPSRSFGGTKANNSLFLVSRKGSNLEVDKSVFSDFLFDNNNLVDVRVDQAIFLVHQPTRNDSLVISDSAIKNCNRIFWVKNDKNEASSVWNVGKEAGYSHPRREDLVIGSLQALTYQDGRKVRKSRGETSQFADEDN